MKKNKMMRTGSVVLVAALLTTSIISGTFAKYTTKDDANDQARVAKFGVVVTAEGSLFSKTYKAAEANTPGTTTDTAATLTVVSSDDANVVAPGTKNDEGLTFSITGKPEVDVTVGVEVDEDALKEIFLKANTDLPDMTTGDATDTFDVAADYYPVVFTLSQNGDSLASGTLADIADYMNGDDMNQTVKANTDLAGVYGTYTLTWEWAFSANAAQDQKDTLLGDLAAGTTLAPAKTLTADTDYCLDANAAFAITVTQVD